MIGRSSRIVAATLALFAAGFAGCGGKGEEESSGQGGGVKTGPGVAAKTINLGVMTDLSGVFAALGNNVTQGNQLYWEEQNAAGGVCGRKVELTVEDHGYDPQRAVGIYRLLEPKVAGFQQMLGAPITTALAKNINTTDKVLTSVTAWPSNLLGQPYMFITGSTYDIETINAIDFLMTDKGLKSGDKVGHVYFEGELGENALLGSKYATEKNGLELVEQVIKATDSDLSPQVSALARAKVDAIIISAAPRQTASLAAVAHSRQLDVPIATNSPGFAPQLLDTPAGEGLEANLYNVTSFVPYGAETPAAEKVAVAYKKKFPKGTPTALVDYGYGAAQVFGEVLKKACTNKDLSRTGLATALRQLTNVDTGGVIVPLDYSKQGQPGSRQTYISRPDKSVEGGLKIIKEPFASEAAKAYQPPAQ